MIDYLLTVGNCMGFSPLLPNAVSYHRFSFDMDLNKAYISFKGKHAMLGFDPAGSMLFIGRCNNEDVFLAMAPNQFLRGHIRPSPPGHSSASPLMSKRHYRQIVMMLVHFLALLKERPYHNVRSVYELDLDSSDANFEEITETMYVLPSTFYPTPFMQQHVRTMVRRRHPCERSSSLASSFHHVLASIFHHHSSFSFIFASIRSTSVAGFVSDLFSR
jgi:hypothetical protein